MIFPAITATYAALLALVFFALSIWVTVGRGTYDVLHGDGGIDPFQRRVRAHANFAEYVPLLLLLIALLEADGAGHAILHALLIALLLARLLHPVGMIAPEGSVQQYGCRGLGALITFVLLPVTAILLLARLW